MTLSSRRFILPALACILLWVGALPALGQIRGLAPNIPTSTSLSDSEKEQIRRFVDQHKGDLASTDPMVMRRARNMLEQPLSTSGVSIGFRIEYGQHLRPVLEALVARPEDILAANALHLAGELATPIAADLLTLTGLNDRRAPVRHAAAFGLKRTFEHLQQSSPVFQERDAVRVLDALARRVATETDPFVLEGYTRAFEAATGVSETRVKGVRAHAAMVLAKSMGDYLRANRGKFEASGAMIRAAQVLRDAVVGQGLPANEPRLPSNTLREIGGFGGDLIAAVKCRIENPGDRELDRERLAAIAASGENVYFFAHRDLGGADPLDLQLAASIRGNRDRKFLEDAERFIGRTGVLGTQPFGLPAARFECNAK